MFDCTIVGEGGGMGVESRDIEVKVFDRIIGDGGGGAGV